MGTLCILIFFNLVFSSLTDFSISFEINVLYFSSIDLMDYLKQGRKKSKEEIANEVAQYLARNK